MRTAVLGVVAMTLPLMARASSFADVPSSRSDAEAIGYLSEQGIVRGYEDGTFRPDAPISRAEALKILMAPLLSGASLASSSPFTDVPAQAWYLPSVERARALGIVAGPPQAAMFRPADPVRKAEFLKMLLRAEAKDAEASFSELTGALFPDVQPKDWHYPYMRYALASSMIIVDASGNLQPGSSLTRGNVVSYLYRFLMYSKGRRTQALLSEAESETVNVLRMIEQKQLAQAEFASARSLLAARGALVKNDSDTVKGAVKIAEGFALITRAYRAGLERRLNDVIAAAKEAWNTAEKAKAFAPSLTSLASQMQSVAKSMADSARSLKEGK
jgi:hypothetical protein